MNYATRGDDVITSAGYRIGPASIEDSLLRHPAVSMAAVIGAPDRERTEIVMAFVVLNAITPRTMVADGAERTLADAGLVIAPVRIHHRMDHVTPLGSGRVAAEWAPRSKAAEEIAALWAWADATMTASQHASTTA